MMQTNNKHGKLSENLLKNRFMVEERVEQFASLTYKYLCKMDLVDSRIENFCANIPVHRTEIAKQFLKMLTIDSDATLSVLARYELTKHYLDKGNTVYERLYWPYQPQALFDSLSNNTDLPKIADTPVAMLMSSFES